jgi:class 3 adenylate cyclase
MPEQNLPPASEWMMEQLNAMRAMRDRLGVFLAAFRKLLKQCKRLSDRLERRERELADAEDRVGDLSLEWQRSQDREKNLLRTVLPQKIAIKLAENPRQLIVEEYPMVTVISAALVDFDQTVGALSANKLVESLNQLFSVFDVMASDREIERVRTMGDSYMCVSGAPEPGKDHAKHAAELALDMMALVARLKLEGKNPLTMRIGMHSGPVTAGVVGERRPAWDLFGPSVRSALAAQESCPPGLIRVTEAFKNQAGDGYYYEAAGSEGLWILSGRAAKR